MDHEDDDDDNCHHGDDGDDRNDQGVLSQPCTTLEEGGECHPVARVVPVVVG